MLGQDVPAERTDLLIQSLEDLPFEKLKSGLSTWAQTNDFFPKPRELREAVLGTADEVQAEAAWQRVLSYANRWHPDLHTGLEVIPGAPRLTQREAMALRSCGGIERVWEEQDGGAALPFIHRDFIANWKMADKVAEAFLETAALPELGSGFESVGGLVKRLKQ